MWNEYLFACQYYKMEFYSYKVICLDLPITHPFYTGTVLKKYGIYNLHLPVIGTGNFYLCDEHNIVWYGSLTLDDCVYFREVSMYREDRINEILDLK